MPPTSSLEASARAWLANDPDPVTRAATEKLLAAGDEDALRACFSRPLDFGTAGMRGPLGPGPGRMNLAVVRGVAHAVGKHVGSGSVVIGFDGRHGSRAFAEESASILGGMGLEVWLFDDVCPTPELSFAVRELGAAAGVMVTASHNPPADNGYKVYDATGCQILPPEAEEIAAEWEALRHPPAGPELEELRARGRVKSVPEAIGERWMDGLLALRPHAEGSDLTIVYTAMHGVGTRRVKQLLERAGHTGLVLVEAQCAPDPDFPTVHFPNPEEPGAMDLALAAAREHSADLVLANDPDADRLCVAVPDGDGWRTLSGDETGWLLCDDLLANARGNRPMAATTIVSSGMLKRITRHRGVGYAETLTGFKWLGRVAESWVADGGTFVIGYEESLGYMAGALTRDKDGVGAAMLFADLAAACRRAGESVLDRLEALHRLHGMHVGGSQSVRLAGADAPERLAAAMTRLREDPPTELGGQRVTRVRDVELGTDFDPATGQTTELDLPSSNLIAYDLEQGRALARPSGTEPKFKVYYEVVVPVAEGATLRTLRSDALERLDRIRDDLLAAAGLAQGAGSS